MPPRRITRRDVLKFGAAIGGAECAGSLLSGCRPLGLFPGTDACAGIHSIDHVVILIQENRSFDHYFGSYPGVRGFSEMSAAFQQPFPGNTSDAPEGVLLPYHLDTMKTNAACIHDIEHEWFPQHLSWNNGAMDGFVTSNLLTEDASLAALTMGYYTRSDLPLYYAVADAFTLCDNYFSSVIGPTDPNRLYALAATLDPDGKNGGPLIQTANNPADFVGRFTFTTMPEQLEARGISWKIYSGPISPNVLFYFKNFQDPNSPLARKAFTPLYPDDFMADALSGNLPQVSWITTPLTESDHPPAPSLFGEAALAAIISALSANPAAWARTALFVTFDENGGFFDHVPPVTAPPGTPGEYLTAPAFPDPTLVGNPPINGPIGLGFRVPTLVISPFSRGGFVSSDLFDHTSILRFLETRFGAEVPNLSAWRRATVGDLTSAFNFAGPDPFVPPLLPTAPEIPSVTSECAANPDGFTVSPPTPQTMPQQEPGVAKRPSGKCEVRFRNS
ncbi:MAG TPA: alkaline phosphatase family protein [Silvibacterium sp.]|nr:alkaline phosphatase family protein [Silvibacterium sp.]